MEQWRGRDFQFCSMCGTMLYLKSSQYAKCRLCGLKQHAQEIVGREIRYTITAEDLRRDLGTAPFVKLDGPLAGDDKDIERARANQPCPKCNHPWLEYTSRQMRSADEGQTIFYSCPRCGHKFLHNT
ncbi:hypothetical protein Scep_000310 [Stephania cephalantha]|uniref:DNA-directed RNA polymerase subunit n=1 Tax=Stephania cephalantha TaxID=152367 RepID=A0AAP0LA08_9MAGN